MEKSELAKHCEDLIAAGAFCIPAVKDDEGNFKSEPILANIVCASAAYMKMILEGHEPKEPKEAIAFIIGTAALMTDEKAIPNTQV